MPRAKTKIGRSEVFKSLREESACLKENRDCTVVAVAVVCGVSYEEAHKAMKEAGRKEGHGATITQTQRAVRSLGFETASASHYSFISRYPAAHRILKSVTSHHPERFNKVWADGNKYLMFTRSHVLAVENGRVHDWSVGRALRATNIYMVTKKESK